MKYLLALTVIVSLWIWSSGPSETDAMERAANMYLDTLIDDGVAFKTRGRERMRQEMREKICAHRPMFCKENP